MDKKQNVNSMFNVEVKGDKNKVTIQGNAPDVKVSVSGKKNIVKTKNK